MRRLLPWSVLAYVVLQAGVGLLLRPIPPLEVLRLQLDLDPAGFAERLASFDAHGWLPSYRRHYLLDMVLPLSYGLLGVLALRAVGARRRVVLALPVVAAACDLVENACHLRMLAAGVTPSLVVVGGCCAWAKWLLMALSAVLVGLMAARQPRGERRRG